MRLGLLLDGMELCEFRGDPGIEIEGLAYDSRAVRPGYMFVALRGGSQDGHDYIKDAVQNGAVALVTEAGGGREGIDSEVVVVELPDSRRALSKLALKFYDQPFDGMNLVGITGTNGKTTTSYLLESVLLAAGCTPGVIGTINYRFAGEVYNAPVTTPESLDLMRILRKMADSGVTDVVMEVSSHALDQGRAMDCPFRVGVFTNISRDHLDYHGSMDAYFEAKSRLFSTLGKRDSNDSTRAVINADDPKGEEMAKMTHVPVIKYGLERDLDVRAERVRMTRDGLTAILVTPAGTIDIRSPLIGAFNIYNIMAASATALCLGVEPEAVSLGIAQLKGIPGRLERVTNRQSLSIVVDYAHTPDALLKALEAVRPLVEGRLITVFGCGGDRDKGKRREMGRVAGEFSDLVFITSDNPRTEDPADIVADIEEGMIDSGSKKLKGFSGHGPFFSGKREGFGDKLTACGYVIDLERESAVWSAVGIADKRDLVLIAGKGHEDYQIIGTQKRDFDDRKVAAEAASGVV